VRRGLVVVGRSGQRGFQVIRWLTGNLRPDFGGGVPDAFQIAGIPHARQSDGDGVGLGKSGGNRTQQTEELRVIEQSEIARAGFQASDQSPARVRQQRDGMGAAAFDPQQPGPAGGLEVTAIGRVFARAKSFSRISFRVKYEAMTATERTILQTLTKLDRQVKAMATARPKPDLLPTFARLEELTGKLPPGTSPT